MFPDQGGKKPGTHQDLTDAATWIKRLERSERISGLKINEVIACLKLKPGDVVADIGSGIGAFTLLFAKAVAPSGKVLAVDLWQGLLDHVKEKARKESASNIQTILAKPDNPNLPKNEVDMIFFHDVFHNTNDRQAYLSVLAAALKPGGRIAIIEQEFDDPIAKKWDLDEDRIKKEEVEHWMTNIGFHLVAEYDIFKGKNNPEGAGMPERWFVIYG
ncbi:MAG: methyltransferase domain-containing protein [Georgfuchsia sp.]